MLSFDGGKESAMFSWEFSQYTTIQISRGLWWGNEWVSSADTQRFIWPLVGYIQPQKVFWSLLDILDQAGWYFPLFCTCWHLMQREPGGQAILPNVFLITLIFPCSYELHLVQQLVLTLCTGNIKKTEHSGSLKLNFFVGLKYYLKKNVDQC